MYTYIGLWHHITVLNNSATLQITYFIGSQTLWHDHRSHTLNRMRLPQQGWTSVEQNWYMCFESYDFNGYEIWYGYEEINCCIIINRKAVGLHWIQNTVVIASTQNWLKFYSQIFQYLYPYYPIYVKAKSRPTLKCQLLMLYSRISAMVSLEELSLAGNATFDLATEVDFARHQSLRKLNLTFTNFTDVPER